MIEVIQDVIGDSAANLILQTNLRKNIGHKIGEDQSGFVPGLSCTDNIFVLQQIKGKKTIGGPGSAPYFCGF